MASFIPHHTKKKEGLVRKENALRRLIERGAGRVKLLSAAIKVRDGRIALLRAKQSRNLWGPTPNRAVFLKDEERIRALQAVTAEAVLAEFLEE